MRLHSDPILMDPNPQRLNVIGALSNSKRTTVIETFPTASVTALNIESNDDRDNNIDFRNSEESSQFPRSAWISSSYEWRMVGCFAVMTMMIALDAMILVPVLPSISEKYHSNSSRDQTLPITVYLLSNAVLQRFFVAIMEIFGRRNVLLAGLIIFSIGLAILSATPSLFSVLLIGRGIQGAGTAAMISIPHVMVIDMISGQRISVYNCIILISGAIGATSGLILGGVFMTLKAADWRWTFYISAPFCFVLFIITPFAVQPVGETLESKKRIMSVDWTGLFLLSGSMSSLLFGLTEALSLQKELEWKVLLALAAGGAGIIAIIVYEKAGASRPFLPLKVLSVSPATFICVFVQSLMIATQLIYIPVYLRGVHQSSPDSVGAFLVALVLPLLLVAALVGLIPERLCYYRWLLWLGWALNITSSASMALFNPEMKPSVCIIITIVTGLGHGITISATQTVLEGLSRQKSQAPRDVSLIANFVRTIGFCLAIPSADSIFSTRLSAQEPHSNLAQIRAASFDDLMHVLTVFAGIGGLLSLLVGWRKKGG